MKTAIKSLFASMAFALVAGNAHAVPMDFNIDIDFTAPISNPLGDPITGINGMFTADPEPLAGTRVVDCAIDFGGCEISQLMLELFGDGGTVATVNLFTTDPTNPFGQFTGQASGAFGTVDVTAITRAFYQIDQSMGEICGPTDTLCNDFDGTGFGLSLDLTGDGPTVDDEMLMSLQWTNSPGAGQPAFIVGASIQGEQVCGAAAPCGTLDVDPKREPPPAVPVPATTLLFGIALAALGVRRRIS